MSNDSEEDKDLLGLHRVVKPSLRGRGLPPRTVKTSAISIAERIRAARGIRQAVMKVTSYSSGADTCHHHWTYISRKGMLPLETETGEVLIFRGGNPIEN